MNNRQEKLWDMQWEIDELRNEIEYLKMDLQETEEEAEKEAIEKQIEEIADEIEERETILEDERMFGGKTGIDGELARVGMSWKDFL